MSYASVTGTDGHWGRTSFTGTDVHRDCTSFTGTEGHQDRTSFIGTDVHQEHTSFTGTEGHRDRTSFTGTDMHWDRTSFTKTNRHFSHAFFMGMLNFMLHHSCSYEIKTSYWYTSCIFYCFKSFFMDIINQSLFNTDIVSWAICKDISGYFLPSWDMPCAHHVTAELMNCALQFFPLNNSRTKTFSVDLLPQTPHLLSLGSCAVHCLLQTDSPPPEESSPWAECRWTGEKTARGRRYTWNQQMAFRERKKTQGPLGTTGFWVGSNGWKAQRRHPSHNNHRVTPYLHHNVYCLRASATER